MFDRLPAASTQGVPPPERIVARARIDAPAAVAAPSEAPAPLAASPTTPIAPVAPRAVAPRGAPPPTAVRRRAPAPEPAPSAPSGDPAPPESPSAGDAPCAPAADDEGLAMLAAVNAERTARGLRALRWDDRLHRAAYDHSAEQAHHGYLGHGSPDPARDDLRDRVRMAGYEPRKWAEVVGWNYSGPGHVCQGWMDSRGHRAILLDPSLVDAGFARVGTYFTGDFGIPYTTR